MTPADAGLIAGQEQGPQTAAQADTHWPNATTRDGARLERLRLRFMYTRALQYTPIVWVVALFLGLGLCRYGSTLLAPAMWWPPLVAIGYQMRHAWLRPGLAPGAIEQDLTRWRRRMWISTVMAGSLVAVGPWLIFPHMPEAVRLYVSLVLCGWLSGSMASIGHHPRIYATYAALFCGGLALGWLHSGGSFAFEIMLMLPVYGLVVSGFSNGIARVVGESLAIRLVNEENMARLNAAKDAAENASSAKSRFLAVASHDLRQPLHALMLLNGVLGRAQPVERVQEISQQMGRSLTLLDRMFSSVLDFSKLEASAVQPAPRWCSLDALVGNIVADLNLPAAAKGLTMTYAPAQLDLWTDPVLLERILRNLLENALKFTDNGFVGIAVRPDAGAADRALIEITDTGRGIAPHQRAEVFKEYFQIKGNTPVAGLGLGLAIVQRLSELLAIELEVSDHTPCGTRFTLRFPEHSLRPHEAGSDLAPLEDGSGNLMALRVLCIDDDRSSLGALSTLLTEWGCQVVSATSVEDAFVVARQAPGIDVVLSDYALGGDLNGAELILALRTVLGEVPGALLTGDASAAAAHREGTIEFPVLVKPVRPANLRALLEVLKSVA